MPTDEIIIRIGKKGKSNGRWIVGIKLAWLIN
jgi:hypothetical protein